MKKFVVLVAVLLMFSGCRMPRHYEDVLVCSYNVVNGDTLMVVAPLVAPEKLHTMAITGVVPAWQGARVRIEWEGYAEPGENTSNAEATTLVSVRRLP